MKERYSIHQEYCTFLYNNAKLRKKHPDLIQCVYFFGKNVKLRKK